MKEIKLIDSMTGEELDIRFDLEEDGIEINGEEVVRKGPLEGNESQFAYGMPGPGPTMLHHLTR
jgi:hypothetical protein